MATVNEKVTKVTKKNVLNVLYTLIEDGFEAKDGDVTVTAEDLRNYIDTTLDQLNAKNEKAKERAAKKRAEGDELLVAVEDALTEEYQTGDEVTAQLVKAGYEDVTRPKVTARLTKLIHAGKAHKAEAKTEEGKKVMVYAAGPAPEAE